jgi:diguanylate cyclase (GGDEF)-like protein/PAS domain S-box-containing protein
MNQHFSRPDEDTEDQFRLLVAGVKDYAIVLLDSDGRVTGWNVGAERIKGYAEAEILGSHFSRFYTEEDIASGLPGHVLQVAERDGSYEEEGWRVKKDGTRFWASLLVTPLVGEDGELRGFGKLIRDVSQRREAELERERLLAKLAEAARTDALTGLLNRRVWRDELEREIARADRRETRLALAMVDLDNFKTINDELGHLKGDEILRRSAAAFRGSIRESDVIARFGGDEFVCVLADCDAEGAVELLERLVAAAPEEVTASAGVAVWNRGESADDLFSRADRALYAAKEAGRGLVSVSP